MFCTYDCDVCLDAECLSDGCKRSGEPALMACEGCGELYVVTTRVCFCSECLEHDQAFAKPEIVFI